LIVNPEDRSVARVGYDAVVVLPPKQFELFQFMYKAGEHGVTTDAIENQYSGKGTGIRQRKAELRISLIPLSVTVTHQWRIIEDDQTSSEK